jgi:hypothetical protein
MMNGHKDLKVAGIMALGLTALLSLGARADEKDHKKVHPCAKACADCANECESCFQHCVELVAAGHNGHTTTLRLCADCGELCTTAAKLVSRQSALRGVTCEACAKACDVCAAACAKFPSDDNMKACVQSCRDCAKACRAMVNQLAH